MACNQSWPMNYLCMLVNYFRDFIKMVCIIDLLASHKILRVKILSDDEEDINPGMIFTFQRSANEYFGVKAPSRLSSSYRLDYRTLVRYLEPLENDYTKRTAPPKKNFNPSGVIGNKLPRDENWQKPFEIRNIEDVLRKEVYVAALISYWLCKFVLPHDPVNLIRPSTFKIASIIASGEIFSLAIPILASIYRGLQVISTATTLNRCEVPLPFHYVYAWLANMHFTHDVEEDAKMTSYSGQRIAKYYNETEVTKLFVERKAYLGPSRIMEKDFFLEDNGRCVPLNPPQESVVEKGKREAPIMLKIKSQVVANPSKEKVTNTSIKKESFTEASDDSNPSNNGIPIQVAATPNQLEVVEGALNSHSSQKCSRRDMLNLSPSNEEKNDSDCCWKKDLDRNPPLKESSIDHYEGKQQDTNQIKKASCHATSEMSTFCGNDFMTDCRHKVSIMAWKGLRAKIGQTSTSQVPSLAE
ncbi:hypothetical protein JCGZ_12856 [Jatropha curcas]|uniref:Uncharacterized protein n=1 Tax=Jatropha curcas TaxID=180498 RepID=A0A067KM85_JATCU|nr:hypothetical protein JCGZ_12856 [Jatropha curcas]